MPILTLGRQVLLGMYLPFVLPPQSALLLGNHITG